jgi:hypothetical protein
MLDIFGIMIRNSANQRAECMYHDLQLVEIFDKSRLLLPTSESYDRSWYIPVSACKLSWKSIKTERQEPYLTNVSDFKKILNCIQLTKPTVFTQHSKKNAS